jgi:hypothetical protein
MKISVMSLFRDSGDLTRFFLSLARLAGSTNAEFSYFFYENDSLDGTRTQLKDWCRGDSSKFLLYEDLGTPKFGSISSDIRFTLMSHYRNTLLRYSLERLDSDFTLLLDSDVIVEGGLINKSLPIFDSEIAMITPNTVVKPLPCKMCSCGQPVYYDSLALNDIDGNPSMTWACNPFYRKSDRDKWIAMQPVEVSRAFAGAALIRTEVLKKCNWNLDISQPACEHWGFCDMVRQYGQILVVPSIHAESIVPDSVLASISTNHFNAVSSQQKRILNDYFNSEY